MEIDKLIEFRKHLHQNPELSGLEYNTQALIIRELERLGVMNAKRVGKTGVFVEFNSGEPGDKILFRSDHDALQILEINRFEHRSRIRGISHKCGHDGHTAILVGVAGELVKNPPKQGAIGLIFQPSEENGKGARAVLDDENFDFIPDRVFALHNVPGFALGEVVCKAGTFTPAVKSVITKFKGKTSHAAEPENGLNPSWCIANILSKLEGLMVSNKDDGNFRLISVVHINVGEKAYGVSAGRGELHLTLRTWTNHTMLELEKDVIELITKEGDLAGLTVNHSFTEEFFANENDLKAFEMVKIAAKSNNYNFNEISSGFKWGEDFGLFSSLYSGCMFGLGSGEDCPALHNPDYDFPDELIQKGVNMFMSLANHR